MGDRSRQVARLRPPRLTLRAGADGRKRIGENSRRICWVAAPLPNEASQERLEFLG